MLVKFMIPVMKEQIHQGHNVCVCVSAHKDSCTGESKSLSFLKFEEAGVNVFTHGLGRSSNPIIMFQAILQIKKILKENAIDAVICHSLLGSLIGRIGAWLAGVRHRIYFCHGLACAPGQAKPVWLAFYAMERFLAFFTTGMLVMNQYDYVLSKTKKFVPKERLFMTCGMGINVRDFMDLDFIKSKDDVYKELNIPLDKKIVICVARLIAQKGVGLFISAAIDICSKREDVYFLLVGDGPLKFRLNNNIVSAHMESRVRLLGWRDDVYRLLNAADIFILPSYYPEGRSIAILEAMAMAKPVIITNNRGCEDSVKNNETGIVVPMHNLFELEKKIEILLNDEKLCRFLGKNARDYAMLYHNLTFCTQLIVGSLNKSMK